jgi:hypothetical protein
MILAKEPLGSPRGGSERRERLRVSVAERVLLWSAKASVCTEKEPPPAARAALVRVLRSPLILLGGYAESPLASEASWPVDIFFRSGSFRTKGLGDVDWVTDKDELTKADMDGDGEMES